jgi:aminopeptidase N
MVTPRIFWAFALALLPWYAHSQAPTKSAINITHYKFSLTLNDSTNRIEGVAEIKLRLAHPVKELVFDLKNKGADGKGMVVAEVQEDYATKLYTHSNDKVVIPAALTENMDRVYRISYAGIPADGLVITSLSNGGKTFFGDNWPNRASHYLPCVDHPSDKATVEFVVTAPVKYQVVSNGVQIEETNLPDGRKRTHFSADEVLPTKVMVVGVGEFAVQLSGYSKGIPVSAWVFPDQRDAGFKEYGKAVAVLDYFSDLIAPYPFDKLANVQSRTRFGGMENAGCIFYHENSATGDGSSEALIAHEIVHQWYGNTATESDWRHIWLSEGFATYLTHMYMETFYGRDQFFKRMKADRNTIANFAGTWARPVVDSTVTDYMGLLNPNSYEKGGWVLHMLRNKIGDENFGKLLKAYYEKFKYANASTEDFRAVAEKIGGQDLKQFFTQWLYTKGHPKLEMEWAWKKGPKQVMLTVRQSQPQAFSFPIELAFLTEQGTTTLKQVEINSAVQNFTLDLPSVPSELVVDPSVKLLAEFKVKHL